MSTSVEHAGSTGTAFLRLARWAYSEETVQRVFYPAVADLQSELSEAGTSRLRKLVTRCRWAAALLLLLVVVGLTIPGAATDLTGAAVPRRSSGWPLVLLAATLYGGTWQFFGWFVAAAVPAGCALAVAVHSWHNHNPIVMASSARGTGSRDPEINRSAIHVAGDIAGLMFAVGSVVIVLVGLPTLWWFVAAVAIGSMMVAAARVLSQRTGHSGAAVNSISSH
jgi:hypothetical protein